MPILTDIQQRILKEEYPNINLESDTDVERYFELRHANRQAEALQLYNTRLVRKYPDAERRALLLKCYRSRDPYYAKLLQESQILLADRLVHRTTAIILLLTREIDSVNMTDAYSVIKLAEGLLAIISPDRYEAIAFTEKYVRYSKLLGYRFSQMERTAELIRLYVTDTLESVQDLIKEKEEKKKQQHRLQQLHSREQPAFDLSRIVFSQKDLDRILLPPSVTRTEDQVIGYCFRYWNLVSDPAFERTIVLYSRKYRTRHGEIYQAVKTGRIRNWKDEEILNAVLANVVTGYYYNISGDLYLQHTWARYKSQLGETPAVAASGTGPNLAPVRKATRKARPVSGKSPVSAQKEQTGRNVKDAGSLRTVRPAPAARSKVTPFKARTRETGKNRPGVPPAPKLMANSIADIIRKMTGKTYTVYKELFFRGIRPSIRTALASAKTRKGLSFDSSQNDAEELVFGFLFEHYNDPYQNWAESDECHRIEDLGFHLPEIEPVIRGWISRNN
jgi:hypothetical protein